MSNDLATSIDVAELAGALQMGMARMVRRLRRETDGEHSTSMISALASLSRLGPITLGELAEAEGVSRPSMTVLAATLEARGLLSREADASDRRLVRVRITTSGRLALQRSRRLRNAYLARRLRRLDETERRVLAEASVLLERLLEEG